MCETADSLTPDGPLHRPRIKVHTLVGPTVDIVLRAGSRGARKSVGRLAPPCFLRLYSLDILELINLDLFELILINLRVSVMRRPHSKVKREIKNRLKQKKLCAFEGERLRGGRGGNI